MLVISLVSNYLIFQRKEKNNLRIETFPAAERKTVSREIQNELLEIPCFK